MLIVFEGIDGSGKTSLCQAVMLSLRSLGLKAIGTSEFGRADAWSVKGKADLMAARNQREQYNAVMLTRLAHQGAVFNKTPVDTVILMDRYLPSTIAYQSCQSLPMATMLHDHAVHNLPAPEHTFFIHIDPAVAQARVKHRGDMDKFDSKDVDHFQQIHNRFQAAMRILNDSNDWEFSTVRSDRHLSVIRDECVATIMRKVNEASSEVAA